MADAKRNTPNLLDRLRRQSDAVRASETPSRSTEDVLQDIDQRLWRAYRWLDEAIAHLSVIHPVIPQEFRIESQFTLSGLRFEQGFVSYRRRHLAGQDLLDYVEVFYKLSGTPPIKVRIPPSAVGAMEARLRTSGIPYRYEAQQDERKVITSGTFTITPAVTASVRFDPDYRAQEIGVRLTNVDRFESVHLDFKPDRLDEAALEELVRLMLGESNAFLRLAPLSGIGPARKAALMEEPVAYRVEKTLRHR